MLMVIVAISIITLVPVANNMNERIIIFSEIDRKFIKDIYSSVPKELTTYLVAEAYDFKSIEKAQEWIEQSGFPNLVILKQTI